MDYTLKKLDDIFNIAIIISSILLVMMISIQILRNISNEIDLLFLRVQYWICFLFMIDFIYRLLRSSNRKHYLIHNWLFFVISIPFAIIARKVELDINPLADFLLKIIPLIRGAYGLIIVINWITKNKISNLMISYLLILASMIWFSALIFYYFESKVNPEVSDFSKAFWWSLLCATTDDSDISPITNIGKLLSVFLNMTGMMIFPIFTVYFSNKLQHNVASSNKTSRL